MGENRQHGANFFPPKDLVYFLFKTRHNSKAQPFFSIRNFPAKRLKNIYEKFFQLLYNSADGKIFPPKDINSMNFCFNCGWPFKSAEFSRKHRSSLRYFFPNQVERDLK